MEIYTVSLFGHRQIKNPFVVEHNLDNIVRDLLLKKEYVSFLVGRDGEFDLLAAAVIRRCRRSLGDKNSELIWVQPYMTAKYSSNEKAFLNYYDVVQVSQDAAGVYYKSAIQIRNREMVDRSDFVIFCVERESGGAYQTMQYALKQGVSHINLKSDVIWEK